MVRGHRLIHNTIARERDRHILTGDPRLRARDHERRYDREYHVERLGD